MATMDTKKISANAVSNVALPSYRNSSVNVSVSSKEPKELAAAVASKLTRPEVNAASVIEKLEKDTHDINELVAELARKFHHHKVGSLVPRRVVIGNRPPMPTEDCRCQSVRMPRSNLGALAGA